VELAVSAINAALAGQNGAQRDKIIIPRASKP
jgi:hypothetical protein